MGRKKNSKHKVSKKKSVLLNRFGHDDDFEYGSESSRAPLNAGENVHDDIVHDDNTRGRSSFGRRSYNDLNDEGRQKLTNHNLNNLLSSHTSGYHNSSSYGEGANGNNNGVSGFAPRSYGSVALDMDQFTREQQHLAGERRSGEQNGDYLHWGDSSDNSSEFGGSNPLSDHLSDLSSLDDFAYYADDLDEAAQTEQWPDIKLLEEFVKQETEFHQEEHRLEQRRKSQEEHVTFPPIDDTILPTNELVSVNDEEDQSYEGDVRSPLLANKKVNEMDSIDLFRKNRIPRYSDWNHNNKDMKSILNNFNNNLQRNQPFAERKVASSSDSQSKLKHRIDPELNRFSYFRQNLDKTIHSPTISGLLLEEPEPLNTLKVRADELAGGGLKTALRNALRAALRRPKARNALEELFRPLYYSRDPLAGTNLATGANTPKPNASKDVSEAPASSANSVRKMSSGEQANNLQPLSLKASGSAPAVEINVGTNTNGGATISASPSVSHGKFLSPMTPIHDNTASEGEPEIVVREEPETYPFWLDVLDPTIEELKILSKTFGIHPLTTEDIFLRETREKVETFNSYYFICFRSFDVIHERRMQKAKENKKLSKLKELYQEDETIFDKIWKKFFSKKDDRRYSLSGADHKYGRDNSSVWSKGKKLKEEVSPLNMYLVVFRDAVLTFHFSATPHPINVRRRIRGNDSLVSSDWMCYALLDNIIDGFAPMIESIEAEVNNIEDSILKIHGGDTDSEEDTDDESDNDEFLERRALRRANNSTMNNIFFKRKRTQSTVDADGVGARLFGNSGSNYQGSRSGRRRGSKKSTNSSSSTSSSKSFEIIGWKRKGDMLRRIGECRKRVMSLIRLLGSKPGVIKGFSIRTKEDERRGGLRLGPGYLSDIQDHVLTMVQSLKHCEKLSARFHKNYLAQLNIDMTQVSNDTNDVLGKITILGTIVLPINVVTGLWGMNCIVPGQDSPGLTWFWSIVACMVVFSVVAYNFAKRVTGL